MRKQDNSGFAQEGTPIPVGSTPRAIAIADYNGDGKLDLAVVNQSQSVTVLLRKPDNTGYAQEGAVLPVSNGSIDVASADFNNDQKPDLAVAGGAGLHVFLRQPGNMGFSEAMGSPVSLGGSPKALTIADFNSDTRPDVAVVIISSGVRVLLGQPGGSFASEGATITTGSNPQAIATGDFNGDVRPDLAVPDANGLRPVTVLLRQAAGGFTPEPNPVTVPSYPTDIVVANFNGDTRPDFAVTNADSDQVSVFLRKPDSTGFVADSGSPFSTGDGPQSVAAGDLNGDGAPDLAVSNGSAPTVNVLLNTTPGLPPDTSITSGPAGTTGDSTPEFTFASAPAGASFECRVDSASFATCTSPHSVSALADGQHTFEVRATNGNGTDASPAARTFTVDTQAPDTSIDEGPTASTDDTTPTFGFSANEGAVFECRVDGAPFSACSSPFTTTSLADGPHKFEVRAIDNAGNADASPAVRDFFVDTDVVAHFSGPASTSAIGSTLFDARESGKATRYLWDLNGDDRNDIGCSSDRPLVSVRMGATIGGGGGGPGAERIGPLGSTTVRLTAIGAGGARSTTSQSVSVVGNSGDAAITKAVAQPISCLSAQDHVVAGITCRPSTVDFGVVSADGCFERITGQENVPPHERPILDAAITAFNESSRKRQYVRVSCTEIFLKNCSRREGEITRAEIDPLLAGTDLLVARRQIEVNGLTFEPQGNATIVVFPQLGRIISSNAIVKLGNVRLPIATRVNLDVEGNGPIYANPFRGGGRLTLLSFNPGNALPGVAGFGLDGQLKLDLVDEGREKYSEAGINLRLPGVFSVFGGSPPSGQVALRAYNGRGLVIDDIDLRVPKTDLGGLRFENVRFHYNARGDNDNVPSTCAAKWWKATADVFFGRGGGGDTGFRLSPPPSQNGIAFCDGEFASAGGILQFGDAAPQVFPGVFLTEVGFATQLNPTLLRGSAKLSVAGVSDVDGALIMAFPSSSAPYTLTTADAGAQFAPLAGKRFTSTTVGVGGTAGVDVPLFGRIQLGNAYFLYSYPDYLAFGGGAFLPLPGVTARLKLDGEMAVASARFSFHGDGELCILIEEICGGAEAWVTSTGVVACGDIAGELHPGAGYRWGATLPEIWFPDGCKPSGYWVNVQGARAAQAGGARTFSVGKDVSTQRVRLIGEGGAPQVEVRGPDGETVSTAGGTFVHGPHIHILRQTANGITYIGVAAAKPGAYTVTPLEGSPAIVRLETSRPATVPRMKASVSGHGARRTLRYDVSRARAQRVTFFEQGPSTKVRIGSVTGGKGRIKFKPDLTGPAPRSVVALVEAGGYRVAEKTVARYRFSVARPGRPGRLVVRRKRGTVTARWKPARGAVRYGVVVRQRSGKQKLLEVGARHRSIQVKNVPSAQSGTVTVRALGVLGDSGPARRGRWRATAKQKSRFKPFSELSRKRR